jgi:hypothetical protein
MFRNLRTRLFAAALLLPLIAFATATGGYWLRCRVTGAVVDACCCGDEAQASQAAPNATVSEADCCDRVDSQIAPTVAELTAPETGLPAATLSVLPAQGGDASIDLVSPPAQARATARSSLGPPTSRLLLIAKSTLLI